MIVVLSAEAEDDLEAIGDFIARDNPARAIGFVRELRERCLALAEFPRRFPLVLRYEASGIRRCTHGSYMIFYQERAEAIVVVHILHGARDIDATLFPAAP